MRLFEDSSNRLTPKWGYEALTHKQQQKNSAVEAADCRAARRRELPTVSRAIERLRGVYSSRSRLVEIDTYLERGDIFEVSIPVTITSKKMPKDDHDESRKMGKEISNNGTIRIYGTVC